jgi:hypothetical protein
MILGGQNSFKDKCVLFIKWPSFFFVAFYSLPCCAGAYFQLFILSHCIYYYLLITIIIITPLWKSWDHPNEKKLSVLAVARESATITSIWQILKDRQGNGKNVEWKKGLRCALNWRWWQSEAGGRWMRSGIFFWFRDHICLEYAFRSRGSWQPLAKADCCRGYGLVFYCQMVGTLFVCMFSCPPPVIF